MPTKLLAVAGPLRKAEFWIAGQATIGCHPDNTIRLDDLSVSPEHCRLDLLDKQWVLSDLGSPSGTYVNGLPVKRRILQSGDEISVGNSLFLFAAEQPSQWTTNPLRISEGAELEAQSFDLPPEELQSLGPGVLAALSPSARTARNFAGLLQISRAIGSLRDPEALPWQLLGMIFDVIPAERGAILLLEEDSAETRSQVAWDRVTGPDHPVLVSGEILRKVIAEGVSLFSGGAPESPGSLLCVPMKSDGRLLGILYLESSDLKTRLTEGDLRLLTAIAGLGAIGIANARQYQRLGNENERLRAEVSLTHDMVGHSARMRDVYQIIERVAPSDSTVLICGESGTGKELVARAIHKNSPRRSQPFVALNCAALTETLLESELFGHEKGAFTSAIALKKGFLEVAEGGTVFLDEIGELPPILQAKFLRVLQEREFTRVGGTRSIQINVRFLAATNIDLQKAVREEKFRADLFHRLNVIAITLPALRERPEDIPALARHFTRLHAKNCSRRMSGVSDQALACLAEYDWPGNIRELENAMERAVVVGSSDTILAEDLPDAVLERVKGGGMASAKYHDAIQNLKKQLVLNSLEQADGSITEAAKLLGLHGNYLHRLIRNLQLRPAMKKQTGA